MLVLAKHKTLKSSQTSLSFPSLQFLGYSTRHYGCISYHLPMSHIYISRNVIFDESTFPFLNILIDPLVHSPIYKPILQFFIPQASLYLGSITFNPHPLIYFLTIPTLSAQSSTPTSNSLQSIEQPSD